MFEGGREGRGGKQITSPKNYFSKIYVLISNNKLLKLLGSLPNKAFVFSSLIKATFALISLSFSSPGWPSSVTHRLGPSSLVPIAVQMPWRLLFG